MRQNLVAVGESDEDRPSLAGTASEVVAMLRDQVTNVRSALKANPGSMLAEKRALGLANSLAKVIESARKLQVDGVSAVENMSFVERAELFITWIVSLPPAYRQNVREKMADYEASISRPMPTPEVFS